MVTFANKYCNGFCLSQKQLNCTRVEYNPNFLPPWQRKGKDELSLKEQLEMCNLIQLYDDRQKAHDLKALNLRERLRKKGIMTTWESRASSTKWSSTNTPLTSALPGSPSCHHCLKGHCPIRTITAIALPTTPTKNWVLGSRLFRKKRGMPRTLRRSRRWKKGSFFMGSTRVTLSTTSLD